MGPLRNLGEALLHTPKEQIRPIRSQDFEASLSSIRPSVSRDGLRVYEEWAEKFGERGGWLNGSFLFFLQTGFHTGYTRIWYSNELKRKERKKWEPIIERLCYLFILFRVFRDDGYKRVEMVFFWFFFLLFLFSMALIRVYIDYITFIRGMGVQWLVWCWRRCRWVGCMVHACFEPYLFYIII